MSDTAWPADNVERVKIADLVPYARNSRTHSDKQIEQIAASMLEFGFTMPILRDEAQNIIAGHGRVLAAELNVSRGHTKFEELPAMTAVGWTDSQKRAYVIADNKLALNAGWDNEALALEIQALMADGFNVDLTGFDETEIDRLLPPEVGDLEVNDFAPESTSEATSGTANNTLRFADKSVPMSEDELERLEDFYSRYVSERSVAYGFVGFLLDESLHAMPQG
jgi:ParB-like chromosome segregation protein Spo0J